MPGTAGGYETRTAAKLSAELQARALSAMELASVRVAASLRASAAPYEDSGEMAAAISVEVIGGISRSRGGPREIGMIATCNVKHADWVNSGTGRGGRIARPSGKLMPVGKRSPNRKNAPQQGITMIRRVDGQEATHWFDRPHGVPLGEHMRNVYAGVYRRTR